MNSFHADPELSIVIPVYNEDENVLPLAEEIHAAMEHEMCSYEIVFVDDASTDGTWNQIRVAQSQDSRVRGLQHQSNAGQSAAVWTGITHTCGPLIATLDGDRQNDPADLPRLLHALRDCDFVCGVRVERHDNLLRRLSTKAARAARRRVLRVDFCDTGCGFRVFRRESLAGVFPFNGVHRFLPVLVHANGARTREVAVGHRARTAGASKYGLHNRLWRGIYDLLAIAWYQKRRLPTTQIKRLPAGTITTSNEQGSERAEELHPVEA